VAIVYTGPSSYLLVGDGDLIGSIRVLIFMNQNPFQTIPAVTRYFVLPKVDCVLLEARIAAHELADALRQQFKDRLFLITPITEADGLLPQVAWDFINKARA
jgi:hypothetical protein